MTPTRTGRPTPRHCRAEDIAGSPCTPHPATAGGDPHGNINGRDLLTRSTQPALMESCSLRHNSPARSVASTAITTRTSGCQSARGLESCKSNHLTSAPPTLTKLSRFPQSWAESWGFFFWFPYSFSPGWSWTPTMQRRCRQRLGLPRRWDLLKIPSPPRPLEARSAPSPGLCIGQEVRGQAGTPRRQCQGHYPLPGCGSSPPHWDASQPSTFPTTNHLWELGQVCNFQPRLMMGITPNLSYGHRDDHGTRLGLTPWTAAAPGWRFLPRG